MSDEDPMRRMVNAMVASGDELPAEVFLYGVAALRRYLQRRYCPPLRPDDLDDLAQDAVIQFLGALRRGLVTPGGNPTGYLLAIAVNEAKALLRPSCREVPLENLGGVMLTDDEAAARLDRIATADLIRNAMRNARVEGDATAVRVGTYLLDEIQRTGETPSSRIAAEALELSHAGVAKALRRLRRHLSEASTDGGAPLDT